MARILSAIALRLLALGANCVGDETVAAYGGAGRVWQLTEAFDQPTTHHLTLSFAADGAVTGQAPCNQFSGRNSAPYPWFQLTDMAITEMACADLAAESALMEKLITMRQSEVSGDVLILRAENGTALVFNAAD